MHSQEELDEIALFLNKRLGKRFGLKFPIEVLTEVMQKRWSLVIMAKHQFINRVVPGSGIRRVLDMLNYGGAEV